MKEARIARKARVSAVTVLRILRLIHKHLDAFNLYVFSDEYQKLVKRRKPTSDARTEYMHSSLYELSPEQAAKFVLLAIKDLGPLGADLAHLTPLQKRRWEIGRERKQRSDAELRAQIRRDVESHDELVREMAAELKRKLDEKRDLTEE